MVDEVGVVKGLRDYGVKEDIAHAKPRQEYGVEPLRTLIPEKGTG